ncbi:MAG: hypothetical protein ACTSRP_09460 [Candidatus Helarchaeota archaeon]
MDYNLDQEQFNIIAKAIMDYQSKKDGIIKYLRENNQVIDLEDKLSISNFHYSREMKDREIGIKDLPFFGNFIKIGRIALIKMSLKIDKSLIDWCEKRGWDGLLLQDLNIHNDVKRFLDLIEQFILRGSNTKLKFDLNDIQDKKGFNYFFHSGSSIVIDNFKDLHEAVVNLTYKLSMNYFHPPFTLLTDSNTLNWANRNYFQNTESIDTYRDRVIKLNDIDCWLDLNGNGDAPNSNEADLICIANKRPYSDPIRLIEKKPVNIIPFYGGIVLYWAGALEVEDNAISRI